MEADNNRFISSSKSLTDAEIETSLRPTAISEYVGQDNIKEKLDIYNEYIDFVDNATRTNEEILLKLDKILLEISKYNSLEEDLNQVYNFKGNKIKWTCWNCSKKTNKKHS